MILGVSDPYANEPWQDNKSKIPNFHKLYNQKVEQRVVQYGILYWLAEKSSRKKSIWGDIVLHYYGYKRDQVLARVRALGRSNTGVKTFALDVEKHLRRITHVG